MLCLLCMREAFTVVLDCLTGIASTACDVSQKTECLADVDLIAHVSCDRQAFLYQVRCLHVVPVPDNLCQSEQHRDDHLHVTHLSGDDETLLCQSQRLWVVAPGQCYIGHVSKRARKPPPVPDPSPESDAFLPQ